MLLLASDSACKKLQLECLARIHACGSAMDTSAARGSPCTGSALTESCHKALDTLDFSTYISDIYCDLNGERARTDEWGFTAVRVAPRCDDVAQFEAPATSWGDLGCATAPLLIQLAVADSLHGRARGNLALIWSASECGQRAAVVLAGVLRKRLQVPQCERAPGRRAHDATILEDLLAEACFLYDQRKRLLELREREPEAAGHFGAQDNIERRLEANVGGILCGNEISRALVGDLGAEQAHIYVSTRLLLATARADELAHYLDQLPREQKPQRAAVADALCHGAVDATPKVIATLLEGAAPLCALGLQLASNANISPSLSWRALADLGPGALGVSFPAAMARFGVTADAQQLLEPWLESADPRCQEAAAWAFLELYRPGAEKYLWARRDQPAFALPLTLTAHVAERSELENLIGQWSSIEDSFQALAALGTTHALSAILQRFDQSPHAAARALFLATGAELLKESEVEARVPDEELTSLELSARRAGDASIGVERSTKRGFSLEREAWDRICARLSASAAPHSRLRLGHPISAHVLLRAITHPLLAPSPQTLCARELSVTLPGQFAVSPNARIHERRAAINLIGQQLAGQETR